MYTRIGRRVSAAVTVAALCFFSSPAGAASASTSEDPYAKQVLDLMNAQRATEGLPALRWNQSISNISQDWSNHLATATNSPTFSFATIHRPDAGGNEIPAGSDWYREIIGFNFTPADIVDWWAGSPAHRDAMLSGCATDVGIGYTVPKSGPYAGYHLVVSNLAGYPGAGTIPVRNGAVLSAWVAQGCAAGRLGQPIAPEAPAANGGASQSFQYGTIYWSPTTGAHVSWGGIRTAWAAQGYEGGLLGYPMSDEYVLTPGVIAQDYQGGRITWSAGTGTKVALRN
jgi:uncharacterized protein YkwD